MKFENREIKILLFLLIFIFSFSLILSMQWNRVKSLRRASKKEEETLKEVINLSKILKKSSPASFENISLFSLIEKIARNLGISGKIDYMKPLLEKEKKGVEIKISHIKMNELVKFLYSTEKTYALNILEAKLEKNKDGKSLNLQLNIQ